LIALAILTLPLLQPPWPGHVTPADMVIAVAIIGVLAWLGTSRVDGHLPYIVPVSLYVGFGALATVFSAFPVSGVVAIVQDVFLFAWAAALANTVRTPGGLSLVLRWWVGGATAWGSILVLAMATHQWWLAGGPNEVSRGSLFFDEPNIAGNFFALSFFVLLLSQHPRRPVVRLASAAALIAAIVVTGSNTALLSIAIGGAVTAFVAVWRKRDLVAAVAGALVLALCLGASAFLAIQGGIVGAIQSTSNPLIVHSVDRSPKSAQGRTSLYAEVLGLYETGTPLGRGPASTLPTLAATGGDTIKSAHDDYLATLVERGPFGAIGLLILMVGIGVRAFSLALRPLLPAFDRIVRNPAALVGGVVTLGLTATTHEVMHYRHGWAFLGLLAGLYLFAKARPVADLVPTASAT
jgi:hypothetical protein